ncbi:hypothetical protein BC826DRAFT_1001669 [Russula brevipes]|nr:hypothetical protein BC826DRAFT_1001669 [Russula brevipes]
MSVLAAIASLLLFSGFTIAAIIAPTCDSLLDWTWAYNSRNQNPCIVAAYLGGTCDQAFAVVPIQPGRGYVYGPTQGNTIMLCMCNTVMYSLLSACSACQGADLNSWPLYSYNCTTTLPVSS